MSHSSSAALQYLTRGSMGFLAALLTLATPAVLAAQETPPSPPDAAQTNLQNRLECFSGYRLGMIRVAITESLTPRAFLPGEAFEVRGTVENPTEMSLPNGKLIATVLREDARVADEHWHPIVAVFPVPGDVSLGPHGKVPFTAIWTIPDNAPSGTYPSGTYRVELSYLSGRYVITGVPYVTNFPAAATTFLVRSPGESSAVTFDRARVTVNGKPYVFRAVPEALPPTAPLRITAQLAADAPRPVPVTVTTALYTWSSDTEGKPPIRTEESTLTLTTGTPAPVSFEWTDVAPGAYEVVFTATPKEKGTLPSVLKVRVPIAGFVPWIVFSGITNTSGDNATVTTCLTNATLGTPENSPGSLATRLLVNGNVVGEKTNQFISGSDTDLFALSFQVPKTALQGDVKVETTARNGSGAITDSDTVSYTAYRPSAEPPTVAVSPRATPHPLATRGTTPILAGALALLVALLAGAGALLLLFSSRRRHDRTK